jgi:low affinity Fe/Cu permease
MDASVFQRLLRSTVIAALVVGSIAVLLALWLAPVLAAVGILVGLGVAVVNLRFLDAGVAKVQGSGEGSTKVIKRMLRTKTAWRLAAITAIAIVLLILVEPLGVGMVVGLVIFQIIFVINVARVAFASGSPL